MEFEFDDKAIIFNGTIVLADTHLGLLEDVLTATPGEEYQNYNKRLTRLVEEYEPEEVIIAGDVFDAFEFPADSAVNALRRSKEMVESNGAKLVVTPGNHDSGNIPWEKGLVSESASEYTKGEVTVLHGHQPPSTESETYVIGHIHPRLSVENQNWPCYLYGEHVYKGSNVVVLPTFSDFIGGPAIAAMYEPGIDVPLITNGFNEYQPFLWDGNEETTREFPKLKEFRKHA